MGLDTYASRSPDEIVLTEDDIQVHADAKITLCGGRGLGLVGGY